MFRVLIAIVLMVGSTVVLLPNNADASAETSVEEGDVATDEVVIVSVETRRSPTCSTMRASSALQVGPSSAGCPGVFRPPRG